MIKKVLNVSDLKILLIDDQRSHLQMMKKMFERYDCKIFTVDSAEEAEFILEWNSDFQALITDLKMPWMDGVEFCKDTKKNYPDLQIYALSGNLQLYSKEILEYAGFDGIYEKPITFGLVESMLKTIEERQFNRPYATD